MHSAPATPKVSSTTLIVRDGDAGLEVLMVKRSATARVLPGAYVFPGGAVDGQDASQAVANCCTEDAAAANRRLAISGSALASLVAAIREAFEESGLLLHAGAELDTTALAHARAAMARGEMDLVGLCSHLATRLDTAAVAPWSHWVTPIGYPRRFDTRFFIAPAPPGQAASIDGVETAEVAWLHPAAAIAGHQRGELAIEFPTLGNLRSLLPFACAADALAHARTPRRIEPIMPRVARAGGAVPPAALAVPTASTAPAIVRLVPADAAYAEIGKLDPQGRGDQSGTLVPGRLVQIAPSVWRLTAPNPGRMTGPGTNTYLLSADGQRWAVIDPGPVIDSHLAAILAHTGERIDAVLVTHTHVDHSPGAAVLAGEVGAPCIGLSAPAHGRQDTSFIASRQPADGELELIAGCNLQAIHTPGHASNHVCWWLASEQMLFTGDHVMQGSTVVIDPPDGDMSVYLQSLHKLHALGAELQWLAPGHGFLVDRPHDMVRALVAHRLRREAKVRQALQLAGPATLAELLPRVYDDVPPALHPVAARSLLAHLLKLHADGLVQESDAGWLGGS